MFVRLSIALSTQLPKETIEQWQSRNMDALETFQQRKIEGMKLSSRVWNITDQLIRLNKTNLNKYITLSNDKAITIFEGFTSTSLDKEITLNFAQSKRVAKKRDRYTARYSR